MIFIKRDLEKRLIEFGALVSWSLLFVTKVGEEEDKGEEREERERERDRKENGEREEEEEEEEGKGKRRRGRRRGFEGVTTKSETESEGTDAHEMDCNNRFY